MNTIKITLDDKLNDALNENSEARKLGRAEFIRQALLFYLRVTEQAKIRRQYQKGYANADLTELALEMKDWEDEQVWPES